MSFRPTAQKVKILLGFELFLLTLVGLGFFLARTISRKMILITVGLCCLFLLIMYVKLSMWETRFHH